MDDQLGTTTHTRRRRAVRRRAISAALALLPALAGAAGAAGAAGQSLLERPPNLSGTWVGESGTLYFHFLHRFEATAAPARKVINYPTFLLAAALPAHALAGARYATNSALVSGYVNEWEFFGRAGPLSQRRGGPVDVSVHGAYNQAADSWDGEVQLARAFGPVRLLAVGRGFSSFRRTGDARWAVGGGAAVRLHEFVAVAGDVATLTDRAAREEAAWSVGLQLAVPYTPHTLSLQVGNVNTTTLQGASVGLTAEPIWGFEFTVPVTLSRYFGGGGAATSEDAGAAGEPAAEVTMGDLSYAPATVRIRVGESVRWRNGSQLVHTVTADPARAQRESSVKLPEGARTFHSGDVRPGQTFSRRFTVPGEYTYFCVPHELAGMIGRIIVEG